MKVTSRLNRSAAGLKRRSTVRMSLVTYRNNRLVPAAIIMMCMLVFYMLLNPAVENYGKVIPKLKAGVSEVLDPFVDPPSSTAAPRPDSKLANGVEDDAQDLTPNDVLLIVKTGGTTMWKRMLVHLTTSLDRERINPDNIVVYSDLVETVGSITTVDALVNLTQSVKDSPEFDVYRQQPEYMDNNYYVEAAGVGGDTWGPTGGWIVDKWKFIPLMQHAGENWPNARWYIYMEDDSYLFLPNVLSYLSKFDSSAPHYLGSYAAKSDVVFAHGGAGFALSRGAWEKTFGKKRTSGSLAEDYNKYTADHCCGDQVLAHAMRKNGVRFGENGGDGKFTWGFNPVVHWTFGFSRYNWCSPLMSWHKVHNRDVAQYYELEKKWNFDKPLLHQDFFSEMVLPRIQKRVEWWDNMSGLYEITSANKEGPPGPPDAYSSEAWKRGWESPDACEAACRTWESCMQWSYVEDLCRMDDKMILGQGYAPSMSERKTALMHTSGWLPERLKGWACKA